MPELKNNVYNYHYENRFRTSFISAREDLRKVGQTCVVINLPTIIMGFTPQPTNIRQIYIPGDSMEFEDINAQFMLQEDMTNWLTFVDWIFRCKDPEEIDMNRDVIDIGVDVLDAKHNSIVDCTFHDVFPFTVSDVPLTSQIDDVEPSRFDVSFKINGFSYSRVT